MLHVSENRPRLDGVRNFITDCFNENSTDTDKDITYMQYQQIEQLWTN